jgi:glucan phosphoethanolaminetransferase (alkaline phosphatase superfamily)
MNNVTESLSPQQPNVILITFDALAAQNMSLYGYDRGTTPHLDALAQISDVFKNAVANCDSTLSSITISNTAKGRQPYFFYGFRSGDVAL